MRDVEKKTFTQQGRPNERDRETPSEPPKPKPKPDDLKR
jgi:hypothetical protein